MNSFLHIKLTVSDTANNPGGIIVNLRGNCDCLFQWLDVYQESFVFEQVDEYGKSTLKGTRNTIGTKTDQQFAIAQAASASYCCITNLLSGICGSQSRCYIPLFVLNGYILYRFTFDSLLASFIVQMLN